jgi:hypothetical protein
MYLHLGSSMAVRDTSIVGVFDLDNTTVAKSTKNFLKRSEKEGALIDVSDDIPKAFVVTCEFGIERTFLTQMSAATLEKRARRKQW